MESLTSTVEQQQLQIQALQMSTTGSDMSLADEFKVTHFSPFYRNHISGLCYG